MTVTQFTDAVEIDGSQDTTQLEVKGHSTQTNPLQSWQSDNGTELARVTGNGLLQAGSIASITTDESLIEGYRHEDDTTPKRGLHLYGAIKDALDVVIHWVVQELKLIGNQGVKTLHTVLRLKLTNENTGDSENGQLRAGQVELINKGGNSAKPVKEAIGLNIEVDNQSGGYITDAYGIRVKMINSGSQAKGYALYTDSGIVHLGHVVEVPVLSGTPSGAPASVDTQDFVWMYVMLENGVPQLYSKDKNQQQNILGGTGGTGFLQNIALSANLVVQSNQQYITHVMKVPVGRSLRVRSGGFVKIID